MIAACNHKTDEAVRSLIEEIFPATAGTWEIRHSFAYPGLWPNRPAVTDLLIARTGEKPVVIATERDDNPGASITNTIEHLAEAVANEMGWSPDDFILVEHYRAGRYNSEATRDPFPRDLSRVHFGRAWGDVRWTHLSVDELATLVGVTARST